MATPALNTAPVLSTPDTHIFEDPTPAVDTSSLPQLSDEQIALTYEIERTVKEIREGRWRRIALQFPDHMLADAPRVYERLSRGLKEARKARNSHEEEAKQPQGEPTEEDINAKMSNATISDDKAADEKLFILGDTSYGACCVDEVAAEHVDADVVVHYGRSCLSPPSRLPVIYVFTARPLALEPLISSFTQTYPDQSSKVVLMADTPYAHHIPTLHTRLCALGYTHVHATSIIHDPSSPLPNRSIPPHVSRDLRDYALFHISDPPPALLLTLSSRLASLHIYPTTTASPTPISASHSTSLALRRRYALLTSLATAPIFGILINTLSVKNYMHMLAHVQRAIAAAGKKSYTFVVGKVNAAKVANFSEVQGWVVIGCWESSLVDGDGFWRPVITPWELGVALKADAERVWTGEWMGDWEGLLAEGRNDAREHDAADADDKHNASHDHEELAQDESESESESAPPEFDLRTGQYVSQSRPMRRHLPHPTRETTAQPPHSTALAKRPNADMAAIAGVASPGAEFLRSNRTWQGLGSDYGAEEGRAARMEEGRRGIARGYVVGGEREGEKGEGRH